MSAESGHHPIDLLSACVDGEIEPGERRILESHLETCDRCATLLRDMEALSRVAAAEAAPPAPAGLEARIMARVGSAARLRPARPHGAGRSFRIPLAAAAALAGALALWVAARGFRETATGPIAPPPVSSPSRDGEAARGHAPGAGDGTAAGESDDRAKAVKMQEEALRGKSDSAVRAEGAEPREESAPTGGFAPVPPSTDAGPAAGEEAGSARTDVAPPIGDLRRSARKDGGASVGGEAAPAPAAGIMTLAAAPVALERQLTLREDGRYTITLSESGNLHLESGGYSCALDLIPEEWVEGVPGARKSGAGPPPASWTLAEISALFDALPLAPETREVTHAPGESVKEDRPAAGATPRESGSQADRSAAGSATGSGVAPAWPQGLSMLDRDGSVRALAGPGLDDPAQGRRTTVAERLRRLALEVHRSLIEKICGPLPDGLRP